MSKLYLMSMTTSTLPTISVPIVGQPNSTEDPKIITSLNNIAAWANRVVTVSPDTISSISAGAPPVVIGWGEGVLDFVASTDYTSGVGNSAKATVVHNMDITPFCAIACQFGGVFPFGVSIQLQTLNYTSTTIDIGGLCPQNVTFTAYFSWFAVGPNTLATDSSHTP